MNANQTRPTATILQFSGRVRPAGLVARPKQADHLATPQPAPAPLGSGWYHEAAIRDSDPNRKA